VEGLATELIDVQRGLSLRLGRCEPTTAIGKSLLYTCSVGLSHGATLDEQSYWQERKLFDFGFDLHYREGEAVLVLGGDAETFTFKCGIMER
jgi:hypothetical protein